MRDPVSARAHTREPSGLNRNVRVSLLLTFLVEVSRYLISRGAFAVFVLDVFGDPAAVGVATGINGAAQLLAAFPSGLLADTVGRQAVLTATAAASLPAAGLTVVSLWLRNPQRRQFAAVAAAQCAWGVYFGAQSPAAEAIFADSVASGNRSRLYTARTALRFCGQALGPLLVCCVFLIRGDHWTMPELLLAQIVGVGVGVGASLCSLFLRERRSLGLASEGLLEAPAAAEAPVPQPQPTPPALATPTPSTPPPPLLSAAAAAAEANTPASGAADSACTDAALSLRLEADAAVERRCCGCGPRWVPPLIVASDVLMMLGSGMTIQFFPLFFKEAVRLGPIAVYGVAAGSFASITPAALLSQRCSLWAGRAGVCIVVQACGVSLLVLMALWRELRIPPGLLLGMYVVRTACMNSTGGLVAAMLNDYVPKRSRARWNILDSVKRASWSGSSAVGGVLVVHMGYEHTFFVTAALQLAGILLLLPLTMIVAAEKAARR